jgi:hypothetical protein
MLRLVRRIVLLTGTLGAGSACCLYNNNPEWRSYMKKQLLLLALLPVAFGSLAHAELTTAQLAERDVKFITMEQGHKAKWFDYKKAVKSAKFDLEKKHHKELFELHKRKIAELGKNQDVNAFLSSKLSDMIALHKKQLEESATFGKTWADKAHTLHEAEEAELAQFEESSK